jgi:hypothetical protein
MYHYQKKLQEEVAKYQIKSETKDSASINKAKTTTVNEDREVTIDEMLQTLSDRSPQFVIPVSEFFGWFKKTATPNEQVLLTSFSSIVIPRLAAKLNQNVNNPDKVLSILNTECTQKEKDLITKLAAEIIPQLAKRYSLTKFESTEWSGSPHYVQKRNAAVKEAILNYEKKNINEIIGTAAAIAGGAALLGGGGAFGYKKLAGKKAEMPSIPDFYNRPPSGWRSITLEDPTGPGIPAIQKIIPGIGTLMVIYSTGGLVRSTERSWKFLKLIPREKLSWAVYGDLSFIPDQICKKAINPENPEQVAKAYISLRDWKEIVSGFTQAHNLVMYGRP